MFDCVFQGDMAVCWTVFQGDKIKSELAALVQGLPAVYEDVALSTQKLKPAVTFYHDFSSFLMKT